MTEPSSRALEIAKELEAMLRASSICRDCNAPLPNEDCGHKKNGVWPHCTPGFVSQEEVAERIDRAIFEATTELQKERDDAIKLAYVPGMWKCAKCKCVTISTTLYVQDGSMAANNSPQQCPNNCGPMWRVTERVAGNEMVDRCADLETKVKVLREAALALSTRMVNSEADGANYDAVDEEWIDLTAAIISTGEPASQSEEPRESYFTDANGQKVKVKGDDGEPAK